jgi:hypothetical protein
MLESLTVFVLITDNKLTFTIEQKQLIKNIGY